MTTSTRRFISVTVISGLAALALTAQAPAPSAPGPRTTEEGELLQEIRKLRLDLLETRIDLKTEAVTLLEQTLAQVRAESARLQDEERAVAEQIRQLDAHLVSMESAPGEKTQIELMRGLITGGEVEKTRAARAAQLRAEEARIHDRLRQMNNDLRDMRSRRL